MGHGTPDMEDAKMLNSFIVDTDCELYTEFSLVKCLEILSVMNCYFK